ncbi:hypothetical protein [Pseudomonas phage 71PfluR64PP]|uniref:Uncharacterized protein n=2 Tax=Pifdecavirus pv22PfluR64PP TaxID=2733656 RepID=A0A2S1PDI0_9CAUD|nr:hypothetical protein HOT19_gp40 [Pseudomonas phage 22PfluR64PP]AWH14620.1 hypothetical protein [Pseudomonas phage 22PfluR64PP]AWH14739.1 hypothetical protein [Pseudomonas phage 71PfluR64PP]
MKRNLIVTTELHHGYRNMLTKEFVEPELFVRAVNHRLGLRVTNLPKWSHEQPATQIPHFLQAFASLHKEAILWLLEDSPEVSPGQEPQTCSFDNLTKLADFLKETI